MVAFPWDLAYPLVVFEAFPLVVDLVMALGGLQLFVVVDPLVFEIDLEHLVLLALVFDLEVFFVVLFVGTCCEVLVAQVREGDSTMQILLAC